MRRPDPSQRIGREGWTSRVRFPVTADDVRATATGRVVRRQPRCRQADSLTLATLIATVPIAVMTFEFDPSVQLFGDLTVRWGTIALVAVIVGALVVAGLLARAGGLRADDVAFVAVGIVPGAVIGGRLGYLLLHEARSARRPDGCSIRRSAGSSSGWPSSVASSPAPTSRASWARPSAAGCTSRRAPVLFALGCREADDGPDRDRPGRRRAPRNLGDRLSRSGAVGVARAGPAVDPVAGHRGCRDAGDPGRPDRGPASSGRSGAATDRCSSRRSACGPSARALVSTTWRDPAVTGDLNAAGSSRSPSRSAARWRCVFLTVRRHRTAGRADATAAERARCRVARSGAHSGS